MSGDDKAFMWLLGFITLWVVLTAGEPDLLDAMIYRVMDKGCVQLEGEEL